MSVMILGARCNRCGENMTSMTLPGKVTKLRFPVVIDEIPPEASSQHINKRDGTQCGGTVKLRVQRRWFPGGF